MSNDKYMSYADVATRLNCSIRLVRKLCASRKLKAVKLGRLARIAPQEFERFCSELPAR